MLYLYFYFYFCFLPGLALCSLLNLRKYRFLLACALSHALLILNLLPLRILCAPVGLFGWLVNVEIVVLVVLAIIRRRWTQGSFVSVFRNLWPPTRARLQLAGALLTLTAALTAYLLYAGAYTEMPADVWRHLSRIQAETRMIRLGAFTLDNGVLSVFQGVRCYYFIPAYLCQLAGLSVEQMILPATFANSLAFLLGVFFFGLALFAGCRLTRRRKLAIAAIAAIFYFLHFGVNVFAYIRYYALAPGITNYVIYLAALAVILDYVRHNRLFDRRLLLLPFFLLTLIAFHTQEAVFVYFMTLGIVAWEFVRRHVHHCQAPVCDRPGLRKINLLFVLMVASYIALFLFARTRAPDGYYDRYLIPLERFLPFLQHALIMPPQVQFYEVVTLWGLFVYVLFFLNLRALHRNAFIMAGMFMPLLTVFNPVTLDLLLRLARADVLYRMSYMIPLPFAAAFIAAAAMARLRSGRLAVKIGCALALAGLVVLLFPLNVGRLRFPYSRIQTLRPTPAANDFRLWHDLIAFLNSMPSRQIITDEWSGYILGGVVSGGVYSDARLAAPNTAAVAGVFSSQDPLLKYILVINERDGAPSATGRVSRHWPENIMRVSRYYSPELMAFVAAHPERFKLIWEQDRIRVYELVRSLAPAGGGVQP